MLRTILILLAALPVAVGAQPASGPLLYSAYLGDATPTALAVDARGAAYVVGTTASPDLPTTPGALQESLDPGICIASGSPGGTRSFVCGDAFVAKMNPDGTAFEYFTYLGGAGMDLGRDIAVDSTGAAYVLVSASQGQMPTTPGALQPEAGSSNVWVGKLDADGQLVWGTYLVGFQAGAAAMAIREGSGLYIVGGTSSPDLPVTPDAIQPGIRGPTDGFVVKLSLDGSRILYGSYLGGSDSDGIGDIVLAPDGSLLLGGQTESADFPVTPGAVQPTYPSESLSGTGFVARISADGSQLSYATYLGGKRGGKAQVRAADKNGNALISGSRYGDPLPEDDVSPFSVSEEPFLLKLDPAGAWLSESIPAGTTTSLVMDSGGSTVLAAYSGAGAPVTESAFSDCGPAEDANRSGVFLYKMDPETWTVEYGTWLSNYHRGDAHLAAGPGGSIFVTARALDRTLPATPGSPYFTGAAGEAALLARVDPDGEGRVLYASAIRNAASYEAGPASPGEWMTIFHPPFGPEDPALGILDAGGRAPRELAGVRVLFDGTPVPLTYVSQCQINLVAPFGLAGAAETEVAVEYLGERSNAVRLPVAESAPALFSRDATGTGTVIALNEDLSLAGVVQQGDVVLLFGTGAGLLHPGAADGEIPAPSPEAIAAGSRVLFSGDGRVWVQAQTIYAGPDPGSIAGLIRLELRVPWVAVRQERFTTLPTLVKWVVGGRESRPLSISIQP